MVYNVPSFLTERGFITTYAMTRSVNYADLCQYFLTAFEETLFLFTCCPHDCEHFY